MKKNNLQKNGRTIAAIDFGSSAVRTLAAETVDAGALRLLGIGEAASDGISEGRVVNMEKAAVAIQQSLKEAEIMSGRKIDAVWAQVTGAHISGEKAGGSTVVADPQGGVSISDINKVRQMARAEVATRGGMQVIATLERDYAIDDNRGIQKPLGMTGHKLTGDMHLVLASRNTLADWEKCLLTCNVSTAEQFIFSGLAAAAAVLTEDEKKLGVCLVDVGATTTDCVIYQNGVVLSTFCIGMASGDIHRDIAEMHHASLESAERAKKSIGLAGDGGEFVSLLEAGGGGENRQSLAVVRDTIAHRADEILDTIDRQVQPINESGRRLSAGVVLVGDGALLPGLADTASTKLNVPARVGRPSYRGENHELVRAPRFAAGMGLLEMAAVGGGMQTESMSWKNWLRALWSDS